MAEKVQESDSIDLTAKESRAALARLLTNLFERWELSTKEQLSLLGLSPSSRSALRRYRQGGPLPNSRDILDRAGWLLSIHKSLRIIFSRNETLRYSWIKKNNRNFGNYTPLEIMMREGIIGLAKVGRCLENERWQ